jgi:hypothetical protein
MQQIGRLTTLSRFSRIFWMNANLPFLRWNKPRGQSCGASVASPNGYIGKSHKIYYGTYNQMKGRGKLGVSR